MSRIALIGENSIEYINKIIDIWNNEDCAVLIDWRIPICTSYEMMLEAGVKKCYIDSKLFKKDIDELYDVEFIQYENSINTAIQLPSNIYKKFNDNYSDNEAVIIYSSGTTGRSKGVVLSHYAININADAILNYMSLSKNDCIYISKVLSHSSTLTGELLVALKKRIKLVVAPTIVPPRLTLNNISKFQVTTICVNPTLLKLYAEENLRNKYDLSSLNTIYVSGSILKDNIYELSRKSFKNIQIYNVYGLTEAGPRVSAQRENCCKSTISVGKPIKGVKVAVVNENGCLSNKSEYGIIHVYTQARYLRYIFGKEKHKSLYKEWINTGDIGFIDEYDELHVVGRSDDIIIIDSHKIYPKDIEQKIIQNTAIDDCVITKIIINEEEVLGCLYVSNDDIKINNLLKDILASYELPRLYAKCKKIPVGLNGKISIAEVKTLLLNRERG